MDRHSILALLIFLLLLVVNECWSACYFSVELQGQFLMQSAVMAGATVRYSQVNITAEAIPIWGHCHRRIGNNVILMDSSGGTNCIRCFHLNLRSRNVLQVHTEGLDKCYTNEDAAEATCPDEATLHSGETSKEILLYKTKDLSGEQIRQEYCPINGRFTFTYRSSDTSGAGTRDCSGATSEMDNCPSDSALNFRFRDCNFNDFDMTYMCLGHWAGPSNHHYLALLNRGVDKFPRYRCALYREDPGTGNIFMAFSSDSTCRSDLRSAVSGYEKLSLSMMPAPDWPEHVYLSNCRFPEWAQGHWQYLSVESKRITYKDHFTFKTYTMHCVGPDVGEGDRFLVFARTQCGEHMHNCVWMKKRGTNVLEFKLGSHTSSDLNNSLCSDSNFEDKAWITQGRLEREKETPCPIAGEYTGFIPDASGLCAKLSSDCKYPEIMYYTVSDCTQAEVYEGSRWRGRKRRQVGSKIYRISNPRSTTSTSPTSTLLDYQHEYRTLVPDHNSNHSEQNSTAHNYNPDYSYHTRPGTQYLNTHPTTGMSNTRATWSTTGDQYSETEYDPWTFGKSHGFQSSDRVTATQGVASRTYTSERVKSYQGPYRDQTSSSWQHSDHTNSQGDNRYLRGNSESHSQPAQGAVFYRDYVADFPGFNRDGTSSQVREGDQRMQGPGWNQDMAPGPHRDSFSGIGSSRTSQQPATVWDANTSSRSREPNIYSRDQRTSVKEPTIPHNGPIGYPMHGLDLRGTVKHNPDGGWSQRGERHYHHEPHHEGSQSNQRHSSFDSRNYYHDDPYLENYPNQDRADGKVPNQNRAYGSFKNQDRADVRVPYQEEANGRIPNQDRADGRFKDHARIDERVPNQDRVDGRFLNQDRAYGRFPNQGTGSGNYPNVGKDSENYPKRDKEAEGFSNQGRSSESYPNYSNQEKDVGSFSNHARWPQNYPNQDREMGNISNQGTRFDNYSNQEGSKEYQNYPNQDKEVRNQGNRHADIERNHKRIEPHDFQDHKTVQGRKQNHTQNFGSVIYPIQDRDSVNIQNHGTDARNLNDHDIRGSTPYYRDKTINSDSPHMRDPGRTSSNKDNYTPINHDITPPVVFKGPGWRVPADSHMDPRHYQEHNAAGRNPSPYPRSLPSSRGSGHQPIPIPIPMPVPNPISVSHRPSSAPRRGTPSRREGLF